MRVNLLLGVLVMEGGCGAKTIRSSRPSHHEMGDLFKVTNGIEVLAWLGCPILWKKKQREWTNCASAFVLPLSISRIINAQRMHEFLFKMKHINQKTEFFLVKNLSDTLSPLSMHWWLPWVWAWAGSSASSPSSRATTGTVAQSAYLSSEREGRPPFQGWGYL